MKGLRGTLPALALAAVLILGFTGAAKAGAFGVPDPTPGAVVTGWFDLAVDGTDDVLPVIVNMGGSADQIVHFIIWNRESAHVWDKNITLTPWDASPQEFGNIRGVIENEMAQGQRNNLKVTMTYADDTTEERYQGYWTAATVYETVTVTTPQELSYPHAYLNKLAGWVYLVDIVKGITDGYPMVAIEAATLWAGDQYVAFMLSQSADYFNRTWWWKSNTATDSKYAVVAADNPGANNTAAWYSRLWDESRDRFFVTEDIDGVTVNLPTVTAKAKVDKVFERFDAVAGINCELLGTGRGIAGQGAFTDEGIGPENHMALGGDDVWLAREQAVGELPYDGGTASNVLDRGGMILLGRFFADQSGLVADYANRMVLWADTNQASSSKPRSVVLFVCDEEEGCFSFPLDLPYELNVIVLDDVIGTILSGHIFFHTRQIVNPNSQNVQVPYWREVTGNGEAFPGGTTGYTNAWYPVSADGTALEHGNQLQLLGWTLNIGFGEVVGGYDTSWSAAFPMIRRYQVGPADTTTLRLIPLDGDDQPF